ncbi:hypothetical protein KFK09_000258 [Dendrobium nobile]|uniref:Uncharacterized protein n=1 Tax=Dendrobium nobile TaxID=94219 RepID=A0A8T3CE77_DENNO|nr:hypothetical protein KFK09_000258 [Dendrobium nobile]
MQIHIRENALSLQYTLCTSQHKYILQDSSTLPSKNIILYFSIFTSPKYTHFTFQNMHTFHFHNLYISHSITHTLHF